MGNISPGSNFNAGFYNNTFNSYPLNSGYKEEASGLEAIYNFSANLISEDKPNYPIPSYTPPIEEIANCFTTDPGQLDSTEKTSGFAAQFFDLMEGFQTDGPRTPSSSEATPRYDTKESTELVVFSNRIGEVTIQQPKPIYPSKSYAHIQERLQRWESEEDEGVLPSLENDLAVFEKENVVEADDDKMYGELMYELLGLKDREKINNFFKNLPDRKVEKFYDLLWEKKKKITNSNKISDTSKFTKPLKILLNALAKQKLNNQELNQNNDKLIWYHVACHFNYLMILEHPNRGFYPAEICKKMFDQLTKLQQFANELKGDSRMKSQPVIAETNYDNLNGSFANIAEVIFQKLLACTIWQIDKGNILRLIEQTPNEELGNLLSLLRKYIFEKAPKTEVSKNEFYKEEKVAELKSIVLALKRNEYMTTTQYWQKVACCFNYYCFLVKDKYFTSPELCRQVVVSYNNGPVDPKTYQSQAVDFKDLKITKKK